MGGELVTGSSSNIAATGGGKGRLPVVRYGEKFEELCGQYMSLGMTYHDYWDGDCQMAKYYREAGEYRQERENINAWLHGMYIYRAILDASPVLNALSKRKTPHKYLDSPIPLTKRAIERADEEKEFRKMKKGMRFMQTMMTGINARFQKKGGNNGGN